MEKQKILAIASIGGHWVQLLRITKCLEKNNNIVYMSTHEKCAIMVEKQHFYKIHDFSRWDAYKMFPAFWKTWNIILKEKPSVIITTGAAPGLIVLLVAKLCCKKTIWIDSIANVNHLSLCGQIASKIASRVYTQWEHLQRDDVMYAGNVLGN